MEVFHKQLTEDLENENLEEKTLECIFMFLTNGESGKLLFENNQTIIDGVNYWKQAFDELKIARTKEHNDRKIAIKNIFVKYFLAENEHSCTYYILIKNLSKAITHQIWSQLYEMRPVYHQDPKDAIDDIIYSKIVIKKKLLHELIKDNLE